MLPGCSPHLLASSGPTMLCALAERRGSCAVFARDSGGNLGHGSQPDMLSCVVTNALFRTFFCTKVSLE